MELSTSTSCPESSSSAKVVQSETSGRVDQYVKKTNVTHAEILWALKVVMSKLSLRSCEELKDLFQVMFNGEVATDFTLGKTKCG